MSPWTIILNTNDNKVINSHPVSPHRDRSTKLLKLKAYEQKGKKQKILETYTLRGIYGQIDQAVVEFAVVAVDVVTTATLELVAAAMELAVVAV